MTKTGGDADTGFLDGDRPLSGIRALCIAGMIAVASWPLNADAQAVPRIGDGEWVRISTKFEGADPDWMLAKITDLTPSYLVVDPLAAERLAILRQSLTRIERFDGWQSRERRATLAGAGVGLVVSIAAGLALECWVECALGVPLGTAVGRAIGVRASGFRWTIIPVDNLEAVLAPRRVARVGVGFSVAH